MSKFGIACIVLMLGLASAYMHSDNTKESDEFQETEEIGNFEDDFDEGEFGELEELEELEAEELEEFSQSIGYYGDERLLRRDDDDDNDDDDFVNRRVRVFEENGMRVIFTRWGRLICIDDDFVDRGTRGWEVRGIPFCYRRPRVRYSRRRFYWDRDRDYGIRTWTLRRRRRRD